MLHSCADTIQMMHNLSGTWMGLFSIGSGDAWCEGYGSPGLFASTNSLAGKPGMSQVNSIIQGRIFSCMVKKNAG